MSLFIIDADMTKVIGYVQDQTIAAEKYPKDFCVSSLDTLAAYDFSSAELTSIYNAITGETRNLFKTSKTESMQKVWSALEALDLSALVQLDKIEEAKIEEAALEIDKQEIAASAEIQPAVDQVPPVVAGPKVRKVRDSKLQRMAAAFRVKDANGNYKPWTVKELMETCSKENSELSERIVHVYLSILRNPKDRFVMPITKDKDTGTFVYTPTEIQNPQ